MSDGTDECFVDATTFRSLYSAQLSLSGVPEHLYEAVRTKVFRKEPVFDAGDYFSLAKVENEDGDTVGWKVLAEKDIKQDDEQNVWLLDHAWTFRANEADLDIHRYPGLKQRMSALFNLPEDCSEEELFRVKWKHAGTCSIRSGLGGEKSGNEVEDSMPFWYILDEFGSRIQNSGDAASANVRAVPFVVTIREGLPVAYSLLFPTHDISAGGEVCRDYLDCPEATDPENRRALSNIWTEADLTEDTDWRQTEPEVEFFASGRQNETVPDEDFEASALPSDRKIKVYAEYAPIRDNLKHPRFEIVESEDEADILWYTKHFKDYKRFSVDSPHRRVNQFPFECVITIKDLLCIVARRKGENVQDENDLSDNPKWLPTTYNLKTELPQFVSYYQRRTKLELDNHWIVKPWNLARALDTHVTPHLERILKQPLSGPKIAQKYLHDPVLFDRPEIGRVKFDIRYILLLEETKPELKVYAYDRFWLRFANKPFELSGYNEYDRHFTVMNYKDDSDLKQMFCHDFIKEFERQNPEFSWKKVETSIFSMFKEVFEASVSLPPPRGIAKSPQSRAMFAADLMLAWELDKDGNNMMQPKLLEINWGPDCERACQYYPEFFDNVFSTLYLGQAEGQHVTRL